MAAKNCWEYHNCGKEKNCPAYPHMGEICYSVKGTLCRGEIQGDYLKKIDACRNQCEFYKMLMKPKP